MLDAWGWCAGKAQGDGMGRLGGRSKNKIKKKKLFLVALGLCCSAQAFSSCGQQGLLFIMVLRLLIAAASHGL